MVSTEDCFPRGGFKPNANVRSNLKRPHRQNNLFGDEQHTRKTKIKKKRQNQQGNGDTTSIPDFVNKGVPLTAFSADTLTYKKVHDGMLVLACVRKLNVMTVKLELPGRCFAEILVQNISTSYTKLVLEAVHNDGTDLPSLDKILQVGTFLPVKITQIDNNEKLRVFASCNPVDVNQHYQHADFTKDMLVWGAIKEKSDHGYLVDMGVKNCRAHLPFDSVDEGKEYYIGAVLYMTVAKSASSKEATTLTLKATKAAFDKTVESMSTLLDKVLPGMQADFLIQKLLKDGLQGQYFDECTGFINDLYLTKPFDNAKKYKEFRSIKARLLYVHPISKLGYFTLKSVNEEIPETKLSVGAWIAATVVSRAGAGLIVKLQGGSKGFITHKRLLDTVKTKEKAHDDLLSLIASKYPVGTTKHCTVLDYYHTERIYICTFEKITCVVNIKQLQLAQTVKGTIKAINNYGLVVRIGKLDAFAPNESLSNTKFSENIKKQFKIGQEVIAKIWNLDHLNNNIILTLKRDLLTSNLHITSYQGVSYTEQYPGVVIATSKTGILLLFYGGVKGWLPTRNIPQLGNKDARNEFYRGQIVKARIARCEDEKLTLTLNLTAKKRVHVGTVVTNPKVTQVTEDGLYVNVEGGTEAFVPKEQLAVEGVGKLLLTTYKVNEVLEEELMCVIDTKPPVLSVRECVVNKRENLKIPTVRELKVDVVMRAIYRDERLLSVPLRLHTGDFQIAGKDLKHLQKYETVCAKVEKRLEKGNILWTTQLQKVFSFNYLETLQYLDQYLQDMQRLRNRYIHIGKALFDLEIGATVDCVVNRVDPHRGCSVFVLPMNCQGLVSLNHCPDNLQAGAQVKGKILWVNCELNYIAITLHSKMMGKIGEIQELDPSLTRQQKNKVLVLHADRHLAVGVLRKKFKRQLVYMPVKLHENDFTPEVNYYDTLVGTEIKVMLHGMKSGRLLAVPMSMVDQMKMMRKYVGELCVPRNSTAKQQAKQKTKESKESAKEAVKIEVKDEDEGIASAEDIKFENQSVKSEPDQSEDDESDANKDDQSGDDINSQPNKEDGEVCAMQVKDEKEEEPVKKNQKRKLAEETASASSMKKKKLAEITTKNTDEPSTATPILLPGMSSFFKEESPIKMHDDSENEETVAVPKKKLTPGERLQLARDEEARLRKIETDLADTALLPQNADQFDRALLGNPDDSEMWTRYIAFHAQSTEFEKARAVARRAIERISYMALRDRLNVWLAYLNLENMYGTKDSFNSVFEEAARCNDTMTIYLETIKMLAEMSKFTDMEERVKKARGKFKQELQMWLEIGKVYYKCGKFVEARKWKDNALLTLTDKKSHMQLIVQNALMEFALGESNQGEALFETILQADPKRVDVWCTYVDQLVKNDKTDLARNVLKRAVGQRLPYKKMRTLFKKYHTFETTYGDDETIAHVTNLLREYGDQ